MDENDFFNDTFIGERDFDNVVSKTRFKKNSFQIKFPNFPYLEIKFRYSLIG